MLVIRRSILLISCFFLLGKDVSFSFSLIHKLALHLEQKQFNMDGDFIHPFSINDTAKLFLVENDVTEEDVEHHIAENQIFFTSPAQPTGNVSANSTLLFPLILNRVILFRSLKIDC
jgi:hypothetical protein